MEIRKLDDGSVEISGYVNAVGRQSDPLRDMDGYFTETIQPGAFGNALRDNPNIPMLLNHDDERILASGDALTLNEDNVGLHVRAVVTDDEVVDKARNGNLRGWSFGFYPTKQTTSDGNNGMRHRDVYAMHLMEVSLLDNTRRPAYPATSVYTRDDGGGQTVEYREMDDWLIDVNVDVNVIPSVPAPEYPEPIAPLDMPA